MVLCDETVKAVLLLQILLFHQSASSLDESSFPTNFLFGTASSSYQVIVIPFFFFFFFFKYIFVFLICILFSPFSVWRCLLEWWERTKQLGCLHSHSRYFSVFNYEAPKLSQSEPLIPENQLALFISIHNQQYILDYIYIF